MKTILLTGSSRGIGEATREELLSRGHQVIGIARHPKRPTPHPNYKPVALDLCKGSQIKPTLRDLFKQYPAIDTLVSNAGGAWFGSLEEFSDQDLEQSLHLNLLSHMLMAKHTVPFFKRKKAGDLLFIGSEAALEPGQKGTVYCAAKFGLRGFALSLRQEVARAGIRVTLIHPGMVRTSFFTGLRFGPGPAPENALEAQEVAQTIAWVLEQRAGVNFEEITVKPLKKVITFGRETPPKKPK